MDDSSFLKTAGGASDASGDQTSSVTGFSAQSKGTVPAFDLVEFGHDSEIRLEERGELGFVTLNRPRDLNALSIEMVRLFSLALTRWAQPDSKVQTVIVTAQGRAFSTGGDMRAVRATGLSAREGRSGAGLSAVFFGEEYLLARQIYHFPKPIVFFLNGLAIGNLLGLAGPRVYRVVTERTLFATPHCGVGFFPDCGSVHAFNACPGRVGYYVALTGARLRAAELMATRLATHYVLSGQVAPCINRIADRLSGIQSADDAERVVVQTLATGLDQPETANTLQNLSFVIDEHFSKPTISEILESLARSGSGWALDTARTLSGRCPFSLEVTLRHLNRASDQTFDAVLEQDYALAKIMVQRDDFLEGVRAVLIDKDNAPEWNPASVSALDESKISACFQPSGHSLADFSA